MYANISSWWGLYGPLYRDFFDKYGTDVIVSASMGGMVEQYSSFDSGLEDTLGKDKLIKDAQIDFTTSTSIGGQTGAQFLASARGDKERKYCELTRGRRSRGLTWILTVFFVCDVLHLIYKTFLHF